MRHPGQSTGGRSGRIGNLWSSAFRISNLEKASLRTSGVNSPTSSNPRFSLPMISYACILCYLQCMVSILPRRLFSSLWKRTAQLSGWETGRRNLVLAKRTFLCQYRSCVVVAYSAAYYPNFFSVVFNHVEF